VNEQIEWKWDLTKHEMKTRKEKENRFERKKGVLTNQNNVSPALKKST